MTTLKRYNILDHAPSRAVGVELGVAAGVFSEMILSNYADVDHLYSIDMWAGDRGHDGVQYREALQRLLPHQHRNTVIKSKFADVLDNFPDEFFDFIYIDGYAHTGQDNGKTLKDWWPKIKTGGLFAGDDYHAKEWPLTVKAVNEFCDEHQLHLNIYKFENEDNNHWCRFPSWYVLKE